MLLQHCDPMDPLLRGEIVAMVATLATLTLMVMAIQPLTLGAIKLVKSTRQLLLLQHCDPMDQLLPGEIVAMVATLAALTLMVLTII